MSRWGPDVADMQPDMHADVGARCNGQRGPDAPDKGGQMRRTVVEANS